MTLQSPLFKLYEYNGWKLDVSKEINIVNIEKADYIDGFWMGILEDTPQFMTQTCNTFLLG